MDRLLIDSSAFVPAADAMHPLHQRARAGFLKLSVAPIEAIATDHVFGESFTVIRRRLGNRAARDFLRQCERSERAGALRMECVTRWDVDRARVVVFRVRSKKFSFVDALNIVVAERLGIRAIFGFDRRLFDPFDITRWI